MDTRGRVVIENLRPRLDDFAIRSIVDEPTRISADVFADGHDVVNARLLVRRPNGSEFFLTMLAGVNDEFSATFTAPTLGHWELAVEGWIDDWRSWRRDADRRPRMQAVHFEMGARILERTDSLRSIASELRAGKLPTAAQEPVIAAELKPQIVTRSDFQTLIVERQRARFSAWYELFPRSVGTLHDVAGKVPELAALGFDVLYLPPIHPIGRVHRKGKNNSIEALPDDVGSPWAIGSAEGGHEAVHPELGTVADVRALVATCQAHGMELALDLAFQCAPDHPWVKAHPQWFLHRPDGSIQFAENPPKQYQDIYPFDFGCEDHRNLWRALLEVTRHWLAQGVRIFRADNPHTKPFAFWSYLISAVKAEQPEVIFLSEAFTRPKVMRRLAEVGFTQSYTYFTWRNAKWEIEEYLHELATLSDFFQPNFWPTTPDILPRYLQQGGPPAFLVRLVLAATLSASYGIYGPAFELCEARAKPDSEEFADSEKYQRRAWPKTPGLKPWLAILNRARRAHPALQQNALRFHPTNNEQVICFSKVRDDDIVLIAVNLDPFHIQRAELECDLSAFGFVDARCQAHDLLSDQHMSWRGSRHSVTLDPQQIPAQVFHLRHFLRREHDFEYFA